MHIHILGIGGTFMGGVALLARALGHRVTGSDAKVYPPMSTQLESQGITLKEGYDPAHLSPEPDLVIIGNALARGNAAVEAVLDQGLRYTSGAQWVAEEVLTGRWVLAVAGTHGKTTTTSMLAWILEYAQLAPGFLVGGVPENFGVSARLGDQPFFVIEADEYDTAFFDKRSKFVHYRPRTVLLNNLEYDHADIFPDLDAIKRQFHHLLRCVPRAGLVLANGGDVNINSVLDMGCWTPVERFGHAQGWNAEPVHADGSRFRVFFGTALQGEVQWELMGTHNVLNALAAIGAARHAGVPSKVAVQALASFRNVKRRLEVRGILAGVTVYDDFAHHPTAIAVTLAALRARVGTQRIIAVLEARSYTMRLGVHRAQLAPALQAADAVLVLQPTDLKWDMGEVLTGLQGRGRAYHTVAAMLEALMREIKSGDHVLIMSNGGFDGIHAKLLAALDQRATRGA